MTLAETILESLAPGMASNPWALLATYLALTLATLGFVLAVAPGYVWLMRKIMAHVQHRTGPYRVGPFGLLQPVADGIKLISKEDIKPAGVDEFSWSLAVYVLLIPVLVVFLFLPWHQGILVADATTGIILVLAVAAISPVGEVLAGWGSNNKYSLLGGLRAAAMDVAYEVPLVLAAASVILLSGTMSMDGIVQAQSDAWFFVVQPIGLFIFMVGGLAKIGVAPVDLAEAESEFVAGFHTEYSGMRFGLLFLTLFANIILVAALASVLFLGGWQGPSATMGFVIAILSLLALGGLANVGALDDEPLVYTIFTFIAAAILVGTGVNALADLSGIVDYAGYALTLAAGGFALVLPLRHQPGWFLPTLGLLAVGGAVGWLIGPYVVMDGVWWFLLKTIVLSVFLFTTWFTLPRVRVDQFLNLGWKVLFPLALLNMVIAGLVAYGGIV
jgi:NADH-quinone oxidoreductase subunit H